MYVYIIVCVFGISILPFSVPYSPASNERIARRLTPQPPQTPPTTPKNKTQFTSMPIFSPADANALKGSALLHQHGGGGGHHPHAGPGHQGACGMSLGGQAGSLIANGSHLVGVRFGWRLDKGPNAHQAPSAPARPRTDPTQAQHT